ncbi:MAG TPA: hypothetical protein VK827_00450, partial [Lysobacter sp.]|nr:hypothetical protein [Lysobacter sp.]
MPPATQARLAPAIPGDGRARRLLEGPYVSHDEVRRCRPNATPRTPVPTVFVVPARNRFFMRRRRGHGLQSGTPLEERWWFPRLASCRLLPMMKA